MGDFLSVAYPWIKSIHVIAIIAWMAGMLYLPRLFVYHADAEPGSDRSETFKVMERRLLRAIMNPAMIAAFIFGGLLLATPGVVDWGAGWIWVKLAAVGAMTVIHHVFAKWFKDFCDDANTRTARTYRIANEIPTLLLIIIVLMVIGRPF
ncbi:MAG: TIGR00701 family protein [Alphaproteobacteria bacterium]|nr:TIGR00701 family protein [Alphaproteobacteria bacterium]|tara:strand:+ start:211 stop:660 length:450 start_codon:yes stop_codon:yes gene_type:complete